MTTTSDIYIPTGAESLEHTSQAQIRLGIQGAPGEGKTWAALTFPNPIVLNLDRGLGAHIGRKDVHEIKMYDPSFVDKLAKRVQGGPPNRRDATLKWLETEGQKLGYSQTLIVDAGTGLEEAFDAQESLEPVYTDSGSIDKFSFWRHKIEYFGSITSILVSLKCNVVYISHEQVDRDKKGELTGKMKPLLTGQYADKLVSKFTDWVRAIALDKPKDFNNIKDSELKNFGFKNAIEYKAMCDAFPRNTIYVWKLESDDMFSGKISSLVNFPTYIPANYQSFQKYMRK